MADDQIQYDVLAQEALRGVVRTVLQGVAKTGLPGDHHFYIAFDTRADGVSLSKRLKDQYADEMTIVLQYQFWDLEVTDERFEVKLSFNNIPERLVVPFSSVKAFFDPSVQFGLQFGSSGPANDSSRAGPAVGLVDETDEPAGRPMVAGHGADEPLGESVDEAVNAPEPQQDTQVADVVELDAFRKR